MGPTVWNEFKILSLSPSSILVEKKLNHMLISWIFLKYWIFLFGYVFRLQWKKLLDWFLFTCAWQAIRELTYRKSNNFQENFCINDVPESKSICSTNMWSTPAVWKQYNKMAVLHFFLVNSSIYIFYSLCIYHIQNVRLHI